MKSYRSSSGLITIGFGCLLIFFSGCGGSESLDEQVSEKQLEEGQENSSQDQSANEQGLGDNDLQQEEDLAQGNQEVEDVLEGNDENNEEVDDDLAMEEGQEFENLQENENDFQGEDQEAQNYSEQQEYQNQQDDQQQYANDDQQDFDQQQQQDFDQDQQEFADSTDNMQAVEQEQSAVEVAGITAGYAIRGQAKTAAGDGLPEYGSKMPYFVKPGDTLSKIATKIFGKADYWRDISELTGLEDPNLIYPGQVVYYQLLEASVNFAKADTAVSGERQQVEVVMEAGQSLWSIAQEVYGQGVYWKNIWKQNQEIKDPDNIQIGTKISLKVYETNSQELVAKSQLKQHVEKHVKQVLQHRV